MQNPAGGSDLGVLLSLFLTSVFTVLSAPWHLACAVPTSVVVSCILLLKHREEKHPQLSSQFPPAPAPALVQPWHGLMGCDLAAEQLLLRLLLLLLLLVYFSA